MKEKLKAMIGSTRFWYAVILSVALLLDSLDVIPDAYAKAIELFAGLGISVRTVDRFNK